MSIFKCVQACMHNRGVIKIARIWGERRNLHVLAMKTRSRWSLGLLLLCSASAHFLFFYLFFFLLLFLSSFGLSIFLVFSPFSSSFFYTGDGSHGNCRVLVGCLVAIVVFFAGGLLCFQRKKMMNGNERSGRFSSCSLKF